MSLLIFVVLLLAGLAVFIASRPAEFRIERSLLIQAAPDRVFAWVNDFHRWHQWSPWAKRDPAMQVSYEGPESGLGAIYRWLGNREVGEGSCRISASQPGALVRMDLQFIKPFQANNIAEFRFQPEAAGTRVSWSMSGSNHFVGKAMGLLCNMDKMVGKDFDQGLASLKALAEGEKT